MWTGHDEGDWVLIPEPPRLLLVALLVARRIVRTAAVAALCFGTGIELEDVLTLLPLQHDLDALRHVGIDHNSPRLVGPAAVSHEELPIAIPGLPLPAEQIAILAIAVLGTVEEPEEEPKRRDLGARDGSSRDKLSLRPRRFELPTDAILVAVVGTRLTADHNHHCDDERRYQRYSLDHDTNTSAKPVRRRNLCRSCGGNP